MHWHKKQTKTGRNIQERGEVDLGALVESLKELVVVPTVSTRERVSKVDSGERLSEKCHLAAQWQKQQHLPDTFVAAAGDTGETGNAIPVNFKLVARLGLGFRYGKLAGHGTFTKRNRNQRF